MSKLSVGLVIVVLVTGNVVSLVLLLQGRPNERPGADRPAADGSSLERLEAAISSLTRKVEELSGPLAALSRRSEGDPPAAAPGEPAGGVVERLEAIEKLLAGMQGARDELTSAKRREERDSQFRAEDGYALADELLAQKEYALAGNGYLTFLEQHPDHPDARDMMQRARDAFRSAGYTDKCFWVHQEMMKKFPGNQGEDLMALAMMEKDSRRLDEAIQHAGEAAQAARIEEDRVWRLLYRAWYIQLRDGDAAGLQAYRDVEQLAAGLGMAEKPSGKRAKDRIAELEAKLAQGR